MLHLTIENGLPSNTVYDILSDKNGFLWFATDKGIARFNGFRFDNFTTDDGLPDNEVFWLQNDYNGRLWMGTYSGKLGYYRNGKFYSETNDSMLRLPFKESMINQLLLESDSSLTIYFLDRQEFINIKDNTRHIYSLKKTNERFSCLLIQYIKKLSADRYEIMYKDRKVIIDTNENIVYNKKNLTPIRYINKGSRDYYLIKDSIYTNNMQPVGVIPQAYKPFVNNVYADNINYFIALRHGLCINGKDILLANHGISKIEQDRYGNYWVATLGDGIYTLSANFTNSQYYAHAYEGKAEYAKADNNGLYFATADKSLYRLSAKGIKNVFNEKKYSTNPSERTSYCYLIDSGNYYTFGDNDNYAITDIQSSSPTVKKFTVPQMSYSSGLFVLKPYIYLFDHTYAFRVAYNDVINGNKHIINTILNPRGQREYIYGKALSPDKCIWYTTLSSVYKIVNDTPRIQSQFGKISFRTFVFSGGYLVAYTYKNQLIVCSNYDNKNITIDSIAAQQCIWDKIWQLDHSHLLISTNNQYRILTLSPFKRKPFSIRVLDNAFVPTHAEAFASADGKCYFIKRGSICCLPLKDLLYESPPPHPLFISFKTAKKTYATDSIITVSYQDARNINIFVAAPSFNTKVTYEYAIVKNNDTTAWINTNSEDISLYHLNYGEYSVLLRDENIDGIYSAPISFSFSILRPFWVKWWFVTAYILLSCFLLFFVVYYQIKRIVKKKEAAYQMEVRFLKSEYKALNALMNPHFIFNALNSVQYLIQGNNKQLAHEYLSTFSQLIRQNMQNISNDVISLHKEVELVRNYLKLEQLRFKEFLKYNIHIYDSVDIEEVYIPPLLIQPLVENAIKHGLFPKQSTNNMLCIEVSGSETQLHIVVTDNGVGLYQNGQGGDHRSFAIENIRARIRQLSVIHNIHIGFDIKEVADDNGTVIGTQAIVTINLATPLNTSVPKE